jgi:hypothetical protein
MGAPKDYQRYAMRCLEVARTAPDSRARSFLSKWLKRGEGSLNRGRALRAVKATFQFQNQTEATKEGGFWRMAANLLTRTRRGGWVNFAKLPELLRKQ